MAVNTTTILSDTSGKTYADGDAAYEAFTSSIGIIDQANTLIQNAIADDKCSVTTAISSDGSSVQIDRVWSDDAAFWNFREAVDADAINVKADSAGWDIQYVQS